MLPRRIFLIGSVALFGLFEVKGESKGDLAVEEADRAFDEAVGPRVFLIGNSLTWDTVPSRLDGPVRWHVDCGKPLPYIFANPAKPCVKTSSLWPSALKQHQYDIVSFQTHYGSTLVEDAVTISQWIEMQPTARVIIHTGWARALEAISEYREGAGDGKLSHTPVYTENLIARLTEAFPETLFSQTHTQELVIRVANDVAAGVGPFSDVRDIYRDKIHMGILTGRYLMHNAMRLAVGQPRSVVGFEKIEEPIKVYFDSQLDWLERRRSGEEVAAEPTPEAIAAAVVAIEQAEAEAAAEAAKEQTDP
ncbi:MAG: hypothetical protein AAF236_16515 [Verrucomicrobiota bacterium]